MRTFYLNISAGRFIGLANGQKIRDNTETSTE